MIAMLVYVSTALNLVLFCLLYVQWRRIRVELRQRFVVMAEADDRYRNILDSVADGIISIDGMYRVLSANQAAERMFGFPPGGLVGTDVSSLLAEEGDGPFCMLLQGFRKGETADVSSAPSELTGLCRDGRSFPLEIKVGTAVVDNSPVTVCIARDLTERKQVEQKLQELYERDLKDLQAAAVMQKHLLPPPATLCGIRFDWRYAPCRFVAGDIFNYFRLDENQLGFYLIDVAGHGVQAAMLSFTLSTIISPRSRSLRRLTPVPPGYIIVSPAEAVADLNRRFQAGNDSTYYFTMVYGIIDLQRGVIRLTQAGHPPPFLVDRNGAVQETGDGGFPVGLLEDAQYEYSEIPFAPGDRLVLYSDGVTECPNGSGELFSGNRLKGLLGEVAVKPLAEMLERVDDELRAWRGELGFEDDVTILVVEREGEGQD